MNRDAIAAEATKLDGGLTQEQVSAAISMLWDAGFVIVPEDQMRRALFTQTEELVRMFEAGELSN